MPALDMGEAHMRPVEIGEDAVHVDKTDQWLSEETGLQAAGRCRQCDRRWPKGTIDPDILEHAFDAHQISDDTEARALIELDTSEHPTVIAPPVAGLADAIARLEGILRLPVREAYVALFLGVAQDHILPRVQSVCYLGFVGGTGTGKGTALECTMGLTRKGVVLSSGSTAYLITVLDEGRAIGIQEADKLVKNNPEIEALIRTGYRRGAVHGFKVEAPSGKGQKGKWTTAERDIFGFKAYDYNSAVDAHLLGRTILIEMEGDDSVDRAMDAELKADVLSPIREWLVEEAMRGLDAWPVEKVRALWNDRGFRGTVKRMGGRFGRDHVIAANLLLTSRIMGWECEDAIRYLISGRKRSDEMGEETEVAQTLYDLMPKTDPTWEYPVEDLLIKINENRARAKLLPMSKARLGGILRDFGFKKKGAKEDVTWRRIRMDGLQKTVIRPGPLHQELAQLAQVAQPDEASVQGVQAVQAVDEALEGSDGL